jgi:hypothetical protein
VIECKVHLQLRSAACVVAVLAASWLSLGVPAASIATASVTKKPHRKTVKSNVVMSCLRKAHLQNVYKNASFLWDGYDMKVGGFVYVQRYSSLKSARTEAQFLSDEESGLAGTLVISQHIVPYQGSPVPKVTKCLGGKMISKPPKKQTGTFTF